MTYIFNIHLENILHYYTGRTISQNKEMSFQKMR